MERYTAEEAAVLVLDEEYPESGESDVEEDPLFPLPNDLNTDGQPEPADIGIPSRTVSPSPPRPPAAAASPSSSRSTPTVVTTTSAEGKMSLW